MKEILESVTNPYEIENYKRLLEIYLDAKDNNEFYASVVSYYDDRDYDSALKDAKITNSNFLKTRSMGIWQVMEEFADFFKTEHRIYINSPLHNIGTIVDEFIEECESNNLPFELKFLTKNIKRNDSIVIGSSTETYRKHIDILRKIAKNHPEIIEECGTPPLLTGNLDGWMGLADENVTNRYVSYTQSRLKAFSKSVSRYVYEHQELAEELGDSGISEIYEILSDDYYDENKEDKQEELDMYLDDCHLEPNSKTILREYIKKRPEVLIEIYEGFFRECDKMDIDSERPTFYKGSQEALLENAERPKVAITDEIREKIQNTSSAIITNMYLGNNNREELSIENKVEIMKSIISKNAQERAEQICAYEDLKYLNAIGLLSDEVVEKLYTKDTVDLLYRYENQQAEIYPRLSRREKTLKQILESKDNKLSDEQIKQKIDDRRKSIIEYLKTPIVTEQSERQMNYEQELYNTYQKDRTFPYELRNCFELHINLIKDDITGTVQKQELKRTICEELQTKTIDNIDLKKVKPNKDDFDYEW